MEINEYLPHHMIFKILSLLPVISLLRCRSVCKYWLSDPHFIQTHLNISNAEQPSLHNIALVLNFIVVLKNQQDSLSVVFFRSREHCSPISLPPQFNAKTRFIAYCNGLVFSMITSVRIFVFGILRLNSLKCFLPLIKHLSACSDFGFKC